MVNNEEHERHELDSSLKLITACCRLGSCEGTFWWWCYPTLLRDVGVEELHGDPTVGPRPKVWTRGQKWKKWCRRWRAGEARMRDSQGGSESDP